MDSKSGIGGLLLILSLAALVGIGLLVMGIDKDKEVEPSPIINQTIVTYPATNGADVGVAMTVATWSLAVLGGGGVILTVLAFVVRDVLRLWQER
jgi:hypothetical protein